MVFGTQNLDFYAEKNEATPKNDKMTLFSRKNQDFHYFSQNSQKLKENWHKRLYTSFRQLLELQKM